MNSTLSGLLGIALILGYVIIGMQVGRRAFTAFNPTNSADEVGYTILAFFVIWLWPAVAVCYGLHRYLSGGVRREKELSTQRKAAQRVRLDAAQRECLQWEAMADDLSLTEDIRTSAKELRQATLDEISRLEDALDVDYHDSLRWRRRHGF